MENSDSEQQIMTLEREWAAAIQRQDAAALDRLIADDFFITSEVSGGQIFDKRLYIQDCLHPVKVGSCSYDRLMVRIYGDTAIANVLFRFRVWIDASELSGTLNVTGVWIKKEDVWQVVARHSSPLPDSGSPPGVTSSG
jgi:ketosteroid isomerase-like protein